MTTGASDQSDGGATVDRFRARFHTVLCSRPAITEFDRLRTEVVTALGEDHAVAFLIECTAEYMRSWQRDIQESVVVWEALRERSEKAGLAAQDQQTAMNIRAYHTRALRFRGCPGDLDRVVELRALECRLRETSGVGVAGVGIARADLALALIDRARLGRFDPAITEPQPGEDLQEARNLIEAERERRRVEHATDHSFINATEGIHAALLLGLADNGSGRQTEEFAELARQAADGLVDHHQRSSGRPTPGLIRAQLLRCEAYILLGEHDRAVRDARIISALLRHRIGALDPGRPLIVLARAQRAHDRPAARENAERALAERARIFHPDSHKILEVRSLLATLDRPEVTEGR